MGFGKSSNNAANAARDEQQQREAKIRQGMSQLDTQFAGFDEPFYQQRQQDYIRYALPQLTQQMQQTQRNMVGSLAGRGLLNSSAGQRIGSQFQREVNTQRQNVADTGLQAANTLRGQINQEKSNLTGQLLASADPAATTQQALQASTQFQQPSYFAPLGNAFQNFSNIWLARQTAQAYAPYMQQQQGQSSFGNGAIPSTGNYQQR